MGKAINLLKGMGSLLEIHPTPHSSRISSRIPSKSVSAGEMLARDWQAVGDDLRTALGNADKNCDTNKGE
ncbi:MAG: hypothetical protein KAR11_04855 [Phycisphaerae bacterium]|nr:hypothetical protein [Phycisphaerae bacterium]